MGEDKQARQSEHGLHAHIGRIEALLTKITAPKNNESLFLKSEHEAKMCELKVSCTKR